MKLPKPKLVHEIGPGAYRVGMASSLALIVLGVALVAAAILKRRT